MSREEKISKKFIKNCLKSPFYHTVSKTKNIGKKSFKQLF